MKKVRLGSLHESGLSLKDRDKSKSHSGLELVSDSFTGHLIFSAILAPGVV